MNNYRLQGKRYFKIGPGIALAGGVGEEGALINH
jgi:hypothetical protein